MDMSSVLIYISVFLGFIYYYFVYKRGRRRLEELIGKFPGPPALPIIGHAYFCIGSSKEIMRRGMRILSYDSPSKAWLFNQPFVIIYDPKNFQIVANENLDKSKEYKFLKDFLGDGLITINGKKWKQNRRILNPAFNVNLLNDYFLEIFHEINEDLVRSLDRVADTGQQIDLWPYIFKTTRDTICVTAMDYRDNDRNKDGDEEDTANEIEKRNRVLEYGLVLEKASTLVTERMMKPWLHPNVFFKIYNYWTGNDKIFEEAFRLPLQIIRKKKEDMKQMANSNDATADIFVEDRKKKNFIEILLESEIFHDLPEQELANEVVTFILTGSETSAITVCFTLLMLAMNPSCQERVYAELQTVFPENDENKAADLKDLVQMTYMEQCIKETLRRFPPAPFILRNVEKDVTLSDGRILPAGCTAFLPIMAQHLNKNVFPKPMQWDPDRFSPEQSEKQYQNGFVPFSTGPRSCIGAKYAMLTIKTQLSILLRKYEFCTDMKLSQIKLGFDIVLRNRSGYKVYVKRRQKI